MKKDEEMNYFYDVEYIEDGVGRVEKIQSTNPGSAFAECLKSHPGCKLIKATVEGYLGKSHGYTEHFPPPVQREPIKIPRTARALRKKERGCEFPFYDEVQKQ